MLKHYLHNAALHLAPRRLKRGHFLAEALVPNCRPADTDKDVDDVKDTHQHHSLTH